MPLPCPDCSVPLPQPPGEVCGSCGLPLTGPDAARLYALDVQLAELSAERAQVLARLRTAGQAAAAGGTGLARSPQTVLLGIGALLLLVATSVFLAVVWSRIGTLGQLAVMGGLTSAAGAGSVITARRGLSSTGTTLAWLAAGLTAVAAQAGHARGLAGLGDLSQESLAGVTAAVGTGLAAGTARLSGQPVFALQAVVASGVVGPALALGAGAEQAVVVALLGGWGLAALALARLRPGLLHPATADTVRETAWVGGQIALLLAVTGGFEAAVARPDGAALRGAVVLTLLLLVVQLASLREVRRGPDVPVLVLVSPALGLAAALLVWRLAEVVAPSTSVLVTGACVLAWCAAGGLLVRRSAVPAWWALSLCTGALLALLAALVGRDWADAALRAAGPAVAAAGVAARVRDISPGGWLALPVAAAAALLAATSALLAAGTALLPLLLAAAALAAVVVGVAAWWQEEPEEPALAVVAGIAYALVLVATQDLAEPVLPLAGLLAAGGVVGLAYACLPRRGWAAPLGVGLSSAASWTVLLDRDQDVLELYTLPVAALLLVVGLVRHLREPHASSWTTVGPAAAMALVPSAQLGAAHPSSLRSLLVTVAGVAVLLLGVRLRSRGLVAPAALVVVELALAQLGQAALFLPRWLVLAVLGGLLLGAGATYESRVRQARAAGEWVRALR